MAESASGDLLSLDRSVIEGEDSWGKESSDVGGRASGEVRLGLGVGEGGVEVGEGGAVGFASGIMSHRKQSQPAPKWPYSKYAALSWDVPKKPMPKSPLPKPNTGSVIGKHTFPVRQVHCTH